MVELDTETLLIFNWVNLTESSGMYRALGDQNQSGRYKQNRTIIEKCVKTHSWTMFNESYREFLKCLQKRYYELQKPSKARRQTRALKPQHWTLWWPQQCTLPTTWSTTLGRPSLTVLVGQWLSQLSHNYCTARRWISYCLTRTVSRLGPPDVPIHVVVTVIPVWIVLVFSINFWRWLGAPPQPPQNLRHHLTTF